MTPQVISIFAADASPETERAQRIASELRTKYQSLHYEHLDAEKKARQLKREGRAEEEKAAWAWAGRVSMEENLAESRYKAFVAEARAAGVRV